MNVTEEIKNHLVAGGFGTFETDLFIGGAPLDSPDDCIWLLGGGGNITAKNITTGQRKVYVVTCEVRRTSTEAAYNDMQELEEYINDFECGDLGSYVTIDLEATTFPVDQDLDEEGRVVGVVEITATIYRNN